MKKRNLLPVVLLLQIVLLLAACGKQGAPLSEEAKAICGDWAYIHDRDTTVFSAKENGTAKYEDEKYSFTCEDGFVVLTSKKGEISRLRYRLDDEGMLLYKNTEYTYSGTGEPNGIIGQWSSAENWTFEFTDSNTFMEDGYFPGVYTVDAENGTFTLVYNDKFEDTLCYYHTEGNKLYIEYPWRMVPTGTE